MDTEQIIEVLDTSETPQQVETVMEKEVVSKLEPPEESGEPEKPPAVEEEAEQLAVNGHDAEVVNLKETEESIVTPSEEKTEMKVEESLLAEKPDVESGPGPVPPPEPDESSETIPEPVVALHAEPENTEQQPVPEKDPEPLLLQTPLAESAPEPEPEKLAESVPEAELQQTLTEPAVTQQPADPQTTTQEEKVSEKVETTMSSGAEGVAKEAEKAAETVLATEVSSQAATLKQEASVESGIVKPAEDEKEVKPVESDTPKGAEAAAAEGEAGKPKQDEAEIQKEEDVVPASGSLSFAILEREQTKDALRVSRTLVVIRGLPGSGKSFLARAIADTYKDNCSVIRADDHGVKPESPESSADGYKALDEAVVARCSEGSSSTAVIVVDDTNHTQDRLARLGELAEQHHFVVVFLEPQTEWNRDVAQLGKKTKRGLEEAQLEAMKASLEEMSLPLFFGWFLQSSAQEKVRCTSMDFLKTLDTLEVFKKHLSDFTGKAEKEVDLEQYFKANWTLHCTTKFCDYGKAEGAKEYAQTPAVKDFYGAAFELSLSALFVTPRTVGARVSLTEEQLLLWPADAEKEAGSAVPAAASLPLGSRAHVTLGCAEGVQPVQTGLDLLEILALQQEGQQGELVEEMELGSLAYFGEGRWLLSLREPIGALACFSSSYGRKDIEPAKKEPEKKKKPKCSIL
ncbi:2',3'-cyclic-nucleotide 3'-phosphodiesterase [Mugil cephalus]|uniref:2',3'-cyclic-nucleotide 3'-phosphodiesterase n=1 Tax=Mugil cephalus TaxID=48193 RepID=UPI001FB7841A|nr:2',3'-cyclic-nucleotide 3'-phosphodiesterase [Mugil cephalus]XP_047428829.1 2',3'-cyclic-nucleotide 3'-phosphodiesterase [Mugil cephalus]